MTKIKELKIRLDESEIAEWDALLDAMGLVFSVKHPAGPKRARSQFIKAILRAQKEIQGDEYLVFKIPLGSDRARIRELKKLISSQKVGPPLEE